MRPLSGAPEPRREILEVPAAVHGAPDFGELRRLGLRPDDVLDFSEIEAGAMELSNEPFNMKAFLQSIQRRFPIACGCPSRSRERSRTTGAALKQYDVAPCAEPSSCGW